MRPAAILACVAISVARDLLVTEFESALPAEPVLDVEARMDEHRLGAMLVRGDDGRLDRVVTRQMLGALRADGVDLSQAFAGEVARPVTAVGAQESLDSVFESLRAQAVGRLPVADGDRDLGIVTRGDILDYRKLVARMGPPLEDVILDISPNDKMFEGHLVGYLWAGALGVEGVQRAQAAAGKEGLRSILDFACGHGRVLRTLKAVYPQAQLAACDVDQDGVRFCARTFGATPFISHEDPARIRLEGRFDLVWCASLLTHLDAGRWDAFLSLFESVLAPSGLLVFTVLGEAVLPALRDGTLFAAPQEEHLRRRIVEGCTATGFGYSEFTGRPGYGLTVCTTEWVARTISKRPGLRLLHHEEGAWPVQDVVACVATG